MQLRNLEIARWAVFHFSPSYASFLRPDWALATTFFCHSVRSHVIYGFFTIGCNQSLLLFLEWFCLLLSIIRICACIRVSGFYLFLYPSPTGVLLSVEIWEAVRLLLIDGVVIINTKIRNKKNKWATPPQEAGRQHSVRTSEVNSRKRNHDVNRLNMQISCTCQS